MAEFFRRYPPAFTWLSPATFVQQLSQSFVIEVDERAVGLLTLGNYDAVARKVEVGIAIDPVVGKRSGVMVEAFEQAFDYVYNYLGYNRIYCLILEHRQDLQHLLAKWHFHYEGTLRDNVSVKGELKNEMIYGLSRHEYLAAQEQLEDSRVSSVSTAA